MTMIDAVPIKRHEAHRMLALVRREILSRRRELQTIAEDKNPDAGHQRAIENIATARRCLLEEAQTVEAMLLRALGEATGRIQRAA